VGQDLVQSRARNRTPSHQGLTAMPLDLSCHELVSAWVSSVRLPPSGEIAVPSAALTARARLPFLCDLAREYRKKTKKKPGQRRRSPPKPSASWPTSKVPRRIAYQLNYAEIALTTKETITAPRRCGVPLNQCSKYSSIWKVILPASRPSHAAHPTAEHARCSPVPGDGSIVGLRVRIGL
jgi:hypothetical protein